MLAQFQVRLLGVAYSYRDLMKKILWIGLTALACGFASMTAGYAFRHELLAAVPLPIVDFARIQTIHIQDLSVVNKKEWFDREFLTRTSITTADALYEAIRFQFEAYKDEINQEWQIDDPDLLFTLYTMNVTAHMWGYGNAVKVKDVGCVFKNEDHPGGIFNPEEPIEKHIAQMIAARIGCCTDHANMMHLLLTKAGIKNRFMMNPGHVFNEAFIGGKWQAFDATTNMWWHDSWSSIQNAPLTSNIFVTIFPHIGTVQKHPYYRPFAAIFRHYMLLEAVYKMAKDIKHPDRI